MPNPPFSITIVRWPSRDAARLLNAFVFGGLESGPRPPRGIDPEYVSYWIRQNLKPDCSPLAMMRVADLLRFYERRDILEHVSRFLTRNEAADRPFRRALYVLQTIGELGSPEQCAFAVRYLNEFLLPQAIAMEFFALILDTAVALATAVDLAVIGRRLQGAIDAAGTPKDLESAEAIPYLKYSNYRVIDYPAAGRIVEAKRRLAGAAPAMRLQELLYIYLGESPLSTPAMIVWAGRMIREYVIKDGQTEVLDAFSQIMDGALKSTMPEPKKEFMLARAGWAILYFRGKLSIPQEMAFDAIPSKQLSFLCDE